MNLKPFWRCPKVVEIQSPDDKPCDMRESAEYYLRNGSRLAWLFYPGIRQIEVCTLKDGMLHIATLTEDAILTGGEVLPGFSLPVKKIFPPE